ncbi:hypothetical protein KORDIASMS9_03627 [Kordia sp. SMS9]|uniref:hypothetical protein n=1 Tax=Kordia sp. SMS9 TaxID=2282170 RepID=UPI000E0DC224|nr:hypothetical protein [Kordia sp. SMS9]AXG71370.1 hypothetical protein KORDIASMS9_03627 [Kordia sp. SMS9]
MKHLLTAAIFLLSISSFAQNLEKDQLWRTKGVYDSLGNFVERAKIQSFLYSAAPNQLYRLNTKDRMNMETGETTVFVFRDTLQLASTKDKTFKLNDEEVLKIHSKDSLTIHFNGYTLPYVKLDVKPKRVNFKKFTSKLMDIPFIESVDDVKAYQLTYQDTNLVNIKPVDSDSGWDSDYKLIDFHGFIIIQGIVSAPKLITEIEKDTIHFLQIDYRFENKKGKLIRKR